MFGMVPSRDLIQKRIEIISEGYHAPMIIIFADMPTIMDLLLLLGIFISLTGVLFVYWRMLVSKSTARSGWWIQLAGFLISAVAYLMNLYDFLNSAGNFG